MTNDVDCRPAERDSLIDRRSFLTVSASSLALPLAAHAASAAQPPRVAATARDPVHVTLTVNGQPHRLEVDARTSLLDAVRDHIGLTGAKKGCDHGQCGACTILLGGRRVLSCMTFAVMAEDADITTVESLSVPGGDLHPMQQAFVDHDAFQCGYCTPGQILSAIACVNEGHAGNDADIREYMSGNLCRCAAYPNIVSAVRDARDEMRGA